MFNTDDIYNEAVRHSSVHNEEQTQRGSSSMVVNVLLVSFIIGLGYLGFNYYNKMEVDRSLVVIEEPLVEVKNTSEEEYLMALQSIESELNEGSELTNENMNQQKDLSLAMDNLISGNGSSDSSTYISKLQEEIGVEESVKKEEVEHRVITVKKGDTLRSLSNKYYGNSQDYKRIIASNSALKSSNMIYEGQKIILPY